MGRSLLEEVLSGVFVASHAGAVQGGAAEEIWAVHIHFAGVKQEPEQCEVSSESSMVDSRPAARISGIQNANKLIMRCFKMLLKKLTKSHAYRGAPYWDFSTFVTSWRKNIISLHSYTNYLLLVISVWYGGHQPTLFPV